MHASSLAAMNIFILLFIHDHHLVPESSSLPRLTLCAGESTFPFPAMATANLLSISTNLTILGNS